ncbi:MAG TPA: hypothetical protein VGC90_00705 [Candidatus Limnocylindrales bacterium]
MVAVAALVVFVPAALLLAVLTVAGLLVAALSLADAKPGQSAASAVRPAA